MKKYYMHLIDGCPGVFQDGQIVFASKIIRASEMRADLKQIRREQALSRVWDKEPPTIEGVYDYSHIIVRVP